VTDPLVIDDPADPLEALRRLLTLEPDGPDAFWAPTPSDGPSRLFGGQVASQSLRAAIHTVDPSRPAHSFHAYFIRPGRPDQPLHLSVERTREGRSFSTRQVTASQAGEAIFILSASFHAAEPGDDWQLPAPGPVPDPETLDPPPSLGPMAVMTPFDFRPVAGLDASGIPVIHPFWMRVRGEVGDDPAMHLTLLTFLSDMGVVGSARAPGSTAGRFAGASLDHAVWFHRPARVDQWLLYSVEPVSNFGARGLARGTFHTHDGQLVASMAQEALLRPAQRRPAD
jgi:acyl-CoA thioesterase II